MSNRAAQIRQTEGRTPSRRGRRFVEFDLGGGQKKLVTTIEPLHRADGATEIETAWTATSGVWQHEMLGNDWQVRAKSAFNGAPLVEWAKDGHTVSLQAQQLEYTNGRNDVQVIGAVQAVAATVTDDLIRWPAAFGAGRHFEFRAHPSKLVKLLTLDNVSTLPAPSAQIQGGALPVLRLQFVFAYSAGLTAFVNGAEWSGSNPPATDTTGAIEFRNSQGAVVAGFDPVRVWDSAAGSPSGLVQRVRKAGPNLLVEVRVPIAWLQAATFPVYIDPTLTDQPSETAAFDLMLYEPNPTTNYETFPRMWAGAGVGNGAKPLMKWDLSSIGSGVTYTSITLTLYIDDTQPDNNLTVAAVRLLSGNSSVTEAGATWNTQDGSTSWAGSVGCSTSGTDYSTTDMGSVSVATTDALGTAKAITLDSTEFEAMRATNYGMVVRTLSATSFTKFGSSSSPTGARWPWLEVIYTAAGGAPVGAKLRIKNSLA